MVEPFIETVRTCVACGYNLFGLGDEPRCPECGLRNIPDEFRRQVWELVDSGKWFFSGPFALFRKRPPGWWWALDRPGDLRKALWFLVRNMGIALLVTIAAWGAATSIVVEVTNHYASYEINDPSRTTVYEDDVVYYSGLNANKSLQGKQPNWSQLYGRTRRCTITTKSRVIVTPNWRAMPTAFLNALWIVLVWAVPLFVGLITQLRKGLPQFARPPLTILAAGAYESHRAIYASIAIAPVLGVWTYFELPSAATGTPSLSRWVHWLIELLPFFLVPLYAGLGWVGPLRSDYTKQLIRSSFHAGRIIVMYALVLPPLLTGMVAAIIELIQRRD